MRTAALGFLACWLFGCAATGRDGSYVMDGVKYNAFGRVMLSEAPLCSDVTISKREGKHYAQECRVGR